jgi:hypothetical protein
MRIADLVDGLHLVHGVRQLLRHPVTLGEARATVERRLASRATDFLAVARTAIFARPSSPYARLLTLAGCAYADLERLVLRDGLEPALLALHRAGVYLTIDEFKGRRPVVRGRETLEIDPAALRNTATAARLRARSSGSRGSALPVPVSLPWVRDTGIDKCLALQARGGLGWLHAVWGVPGGASIVHLLRLATLGSMPSRWFSQLDPATLDLAARYRWAPLGIRWAARVARAALPAPQHVPLGDPRPIARWMVDTLREGRTPYLHTYTSSAVRLCLAALDGTLDIAGAQFLVEGEPVTAVRLDAIHRAGAQAGCRYAAMECGPIGYWCLAPEAPDEVHVVSDLHAIVQAEMAQRECPSPFFLTSLRPTAPIVLLNVSLGDVAVATSRPCGCPLGLLGWTMHLHTIRSFEKLTVAGMTLPDAAVIRVLDETLPGRFGGHPTDYQLVENSTAGAGPALTLLLHPRLGPLDAGAVVDEFLAGVGRVGDPERVMAEVWRAAGIPVVERRPAHTTVTGKILHVHQLA